MMPAQLTRDFWRGKKVLVTGHTGFKGAWLAFWLQRLGARVVGLALPPSTSPSLYELLGLGSLITSHFVDIRDEEGTGRLIAEAQPDIVFHLAAQAIVRESYKDPLGTFETNVQGTANVLDALRAVDSVRVAVAVTTDKVYENLEHHYPYRETDSLGGHDPYSASKAAAEMVISSYRDSFLRGSGVAVASARAGNVIGGGDWAPDRLLPDLVRGWSENTPVVIRNPGALRPWQYVLEPIAGYLTLAERLWHDPKLAGAFNFGPATSEAATVRHVVGLAGRTFEGGDVEWLESESGPHEAGWLALEISKASVKLGFSPCWGLETSVARTMEWYKALSAGGDPHALCVSDIEAYESATNAVLK